MKAWENFIHAQEVDIGVETVQKWLRPLKVKDFDAGNLYLEAQDSFQAMWFEEHMRKKVTAQFVNHNKRPIKVHLSVANLSTATKTKREKAQKLETLNAEQFTLHFDQLDPHATFAQTVPSDVNALTYKVIDSLLEAKNQKISPLNPLYLYGPTGSGKTHLLMAMTDVYRKAGKHVIFSSAQTFTDHVVSAIRAGEMSMFRQAYRSSDVLVIDDAHIFSRKGATQEEFFHTFNSLQSTGRQIILSANLSPADLQNIEPRLVSRFEWGIVLSLESPSKEEREKILIAKTEILKFNLHSKVIDFLLETFATMKSIVKALEALILRSHLDARSQKTASSQLTVIQVKQLLSDLIIEESEAALTPVKVVAEVSEFFGIRPEDILGKGQTRDHVLPRQISMFLCRMQLKIPYIKIGEIFSKDHSTVMSSVRVIQKGIDSDDREIAGSYRSIMRKIRSS